MYKSKDISLGSRITGAITLGSTILNMLLPNAVSAAPHLSPFYGHDNIKQEDFFYVQDKKKRTIVRMTFGDGGKSYLETCNDCNDKDYKENLIQAMDAVAERLTPTYFEGISIGGSPDMRVGLTNVPKYWENDSLKLDLRESIRLANINTEHPKRIGDYTEKYVPPVEIEYKKLKPAETNDFVDDFLAREISDALKRSEEKGEYKKREYKGIAPVDVTKPRDEIMAKEVEDLIAKEEEKREEEEKEFEEEQSKRINPFAKYKPKYQEKQEPIEEKPEPTLKYQSKPVEKPKPTPESVDDFGDAFDDTPELEKPSKPYSKPEPKEEPEPVVSKSVNPFAKYQEKPKYQEKQEPIKEKPAEEKPKKELSPLEKMLQGVKE